MTIFSHQKITFIALFLLSIYHITDAQFLYQSCDTVYGEYDILSDYGANVNESITQLASLASTFYYDTVFVGKGADKVNALFSCRYDIDSDTCQSCVASSLEKVPLCLSVESIQFYQDCTVHYSNFTIFSLAENSPWVTINDNSNVTDDGEFTTFLKKTIKTLISDTIAEFAISSRYFAFGTAKYSTLETIYALAQCNADITSAQCDSCLKNSFGNFTKDYPNTYLGQIFKPSCRLSYILTSKSMSTPYDFTIPIMSDTPDNGSTPPTSSPDEGLAPSPSPSTSLDEEPTSPPPPPSSLGDEESTPPPPRSFLDGFVAPPPPSIHSSLVGSTGTRGMSTSLIIVVLCFGLL